MKKNSTITVMICGLAAVFATVVFYLLAFDNIFTVPMRWISFMGLLAVEVVGTVKALAVGKSILGVTQMITSVLHLAAALVLSVIFVNLFPLLIKQYLLLSLLLFVIVAVIDVLLLYFSSKAQANGRNYAASASVVDMCQAKARKLLTENKDSALRPQLEAIVEMLTYANRAMAGPDDGEILSKIDELDRSIGADEPDKITEAIKQIQDLLKLRIEITKKTGSF